MEQKKDQQKIEKKDEKKEFANFLKNIMNEAKEDFQKNLNSFKVINNSVEIKFSISMPYFKMKIEPLILNIINKSNILKNTFKDHIEKSNTDHRITTGKTDYPIKTDLNIKDMMAAAQDYMTRENKIIQLNKEIIKNIEFLNIYVDISKHEKAIKDLKKDYEKEEKEEKEELIKKNKMLIRKNNTLIIKSLSLFDSLLSDLVQVVRLRDYDSEAFFQEEIKRILFIKKYSDPLDSDTQNIFEEFLKCVKINNVNLIEKIYSKVDEKYKELKISDYNFSKKFVGNIFLQRLLSICTSTNLKDLLFSLNILKKEENDFKEILSNIYKEITEESIDEIVKEYPKNINFKHFIEEKKTYYHNMGNIKIHEIEGFNIFKLEFFKSNEFIKNFLPNNRREDISLDDFIKIVEKQIEKERPQESSQDTERISNKTSDTKLDSLDIESLKKIYEELKRKKNLQKQQKQQTTLENQEGFESKQQYIITNGEDNISLGAFQKSEATLGDKSKMSIKYYVSDKIKEKISEIQEFEGLIQNSINKGFQQDPKSHSGLFSLKINNKSFNENFKLKLARGIDQEIIFQKIEDKNNNTIYLVAVDIVGHKKNGILKNTFKPLNKNLYKLEERYPEKRWTQKIINQIQIQSQEERKI